MDLTKEKPELLAPAGDTGAMEAAYRNGADAVYIGAGEYNLRTRAGNLLVQDVPAAVAAADSWNRRVYLTLNTMPDDVQMRGVKETLEGIKFEGSLPDALIVSDPGVVRLCRRILPEVPLHLSTQTGTFNAEAMEFWREAGVARVILPRELTADEIRKYSRSGITETEIFVHGAMCMSISGRCLMSAWMNKRHPNTGGCSHPCRFRYRIIPLEGGRDELQECGFDVSESEKGVYIMNSKDLNTLPVLPDLIKTGVDSLKIEGRNKSIHYVSSVVRIYREAIDKAYTDPEWYRVSEEWERELEGIEHREYTTGFYFGERELQSTESSKQAGRVRVVGMVKEVTQDDEMIVDVKNPFYKGEALSVMPSGFKRKTFMASFDEILSFSGEVLEKALTNRIVRVKSEHRLCRGDMIRRFD
ncbi:MAG: peptidase U32 family protein [Chitinivibrionales bacterium]